MSPNPSPLQTVRQFQSETNSIREETEPLATRMTVFVMTGFLVAALLFMILTRLDRMVSSQGGKIVPVGQVNVLQALDQSIIKSIEVREGDRVERGQLLARLDPTFTSADVKQLRQQLASLETQIIRDNAELNGSTPIFPERADPDFKTYASLQKAYYDQRQAQYKAQLSSFNSKISQTQAAIDKLRKDDERYSQREEIAQKIETMRSTLAERGSGSQLNLYISQDTRLELLRTIDNTHNALREAQYTLESIIADKKAFMEQWRANLSQELVLTKNKLDDATASFDKAVRHQDLVELRAIEPSVVLTLAKLSVGSVLKPGDPFLSLMPLDTKLEAEIKIASRDIGFVRPGDRCVLSIDAFNAAEHGTAEGKVEWLSEGAFTTDDDGKPLDAFYKARCSIAKTLFQGVPDNFRLIPG